MTVDVERGVLAKVTGGDYEEPINIAVQGLAKNEKNRLIGTATDGVTKMACNFSTKYSKLYDEKKLVSNDLIQASSYQTTTVDGTPRLMILDLDVLGKYTESTPPDDRSGPAAKKHKVASTPPSPAQKKDAADTEELPGMLTPEPSKLTPTFQFNTPGSAMRTPAATSPVPFHNVTPESCPPTSVLSPSNKLTPTPGKPPLAAPTLKPATGKRPHHPISALNPYNPKWTIRAKVEVKQELRTATTKGESYSVFTCILVDDEGSQIETTFWRDQATTFHGKLEVGKVYYFSNGIVAPSKRMFATVDNDYRITMNQKSTVEEATDQDVSKMKAACNFVAIDCLISRLGKKLPVDIVGVVTSVTPLSSVKRTQDGTELCRRELTIVDKSLKSVNVTIWKEQAEKFGAELEKLTNPVLVMNKMRVSDFNGVSVGGAYASTFAIEPTGYPEVTELRKWWDSEGSSQSFAPAGGTGNRPGGSTKAWQPLVELMPTSETQLTASDPPIYATMRCMIATISDDQPLYYNANKANNKKVVEKDGKWYCEAEGKFYDDMEKRYVMNLQVADFTGQQSINAYNEHATMFLKTSADDIASIRETNEDAFLAKLGAPRWSDWVLNMVGQTREYQGNTSLRFKVRGARPIDFTTDAAVLIDTISKGLPN